ncbi:hypothetical protein B0H21DRAFT_713573 [Amylocystis lapponica]|nr:hypothetical protein B0H21DRAFT_713573 [Amylocystis lapponica]
MTHSASEARTSSPRLYAKTAWQTRHLVRVCRTMGRGTQVRVQTTHLQQQVERLRLTLLDVRPLSTHQKIKPVVNQRARPVEHQWFVRFEGSSRLTLPVFTEMSRRQLWRCEICPGQTWSKLWAAVRHEGTQQHTCEIRRRDRIEPLFAAESGANINDPIGTTAAPFRRPTRPRFYARGWPRPPTTAVHTAESNGDPTNMLTYMTTGEDHWEKLAPIPSKSQRDLKRTMCRLRTAHWNHHLSFLMGAWKTRLNGIARRRNTARGYQTRPEYIKQLFGEQDWWPWMDKESCLLDIMGAFPRALFSESELEATNGLLRRTSGVYNEDEFSNPLVRPFLQTYAEDGGTRLQEARQGSRWLHEVDANCFIVDGRPDASLDIPLSALLLSVQELASPEIRQCYRLPAPDAIAGVLVSNDHHTPLEKWSKPLRNPWRDRADSKRVLSLPLWLYCDDTSGNSSKKWNKHNSILLTLAGLPHHLAQLLYNIHFICTSNLAAPLEMMENLSEKLQKARDDGIEVWDCLTDEKVLIIPWVLAFLGDNPMASEFASHVGMSGKCFCRVCKVRGADEKNCGAGQAGAKERLHEFLNAGDPRTKTETLHDLGAQLKCALEGAPSKVDDMARESGTKDKYFQHFLDLIQAEANRIRKANKGVPAADGTTKVDQLKAALKKFRAELPENMFNPTLLVPVKYFWRDAVSRQSDEDKEILKTRLSSANVAGLEISPLRGHTLVQYAGSLVAPSVLHGMIPEEAYEAWVALCRLAPLVFQPAIENLLEYLISLQNAITDFLAATALWTTQWFNKPKFHLFLHLLEHIKRFGPAALYSTEGFESYNLVIRLRSVHSSGKPEFSL